MLEIKNFQLPTFQIDKRYFIGGVVLAILVPIIIASVFLKQLGELKSEKRHLKNEISASKKQIELLENNIANIERENKLLALKVTASIATADSLINLVELREIKILEIKKYGQNEINNYLALPIDERQRVFAKLIGR
jgi:hypothetical protein